MLEETQPYPEGQDDYASTAPRLPYIHIPPPATTNTSPPPEQPPPVHQSSTSSSDMDQLLATHRLGRIRQVYKSEVSKFFVLGASYFISGILFLLPLISLVFNRGGYVRGFALIAMSIAGLSLISGGINRINLAINNIFLKVRTQNVRYYLCTYGVMSIRRKEVRAMRWDQVRTVQELSLENSPVPHEYVLYPLNDKEPFVLENVCVRFKAFRAHVEREITRHLLPASIAAYNAGQTLDFGAITATPAGLRVLEEHLPWQKIGSNCEDKGYFVIKEKGTLSIWATVDISTILNFRVLLALIKHVKSENASEKSDRPSIRYQFSTIVTEEPSEWQAYE